MGLTFVLKKLCSKFEAVEETKRQTLYFKKNEGKNFFLQMLKYQLANDNDKKRKGKVQHKKIVIYN